MVWNVLASPKIDNIGFGAHGHIQKSRNHRNEGVHGSHISKSKSYKFKLEQNNATELLSISFQQIYHKKGPSMSTNVKNDVFF